MDPEIDLSELSREQLVCLLYDICLSSSERVDAIAYAQGSFSRLDFLGVLLTALGLIAIFGGLYTFGNFRGTIIQQTKTETERVAREQLESYFERLDERINRLERMFGSRAFVNARRAGKVPIPDGSLITADDKGDKGG